MDARSSGPRQPVVVAWNEAISNVDRAVTLHKCDLCVEVCARIGRVRSHDVPERHAGRIFVVPDHLLTLSGLQFGRRIALPVIYSRVESWVGDLIIASGAGPSPRPTS